MCTPEAAGGGGPRISQPRYWARIGGALDRLVGGEVLAADEAAGLLHAFGQQVAERAAVQRALAHLGNQGEGFGIVALHEFLPGGELGAAGHQAGGDQFVLRQVGGGSADAVGQVWGNLETAGGVADRRLHDVGQRHGPEFLERQAPRAQRAGGGDRLGADQVLVAHDVEHLGRAAGDGAIHVRAAGAGHHALAVDHDMGAVGQPDVAHPAADQPDHHRLDHGKRELGGHGGVHRVAAGGEHLGARGGGERVVADGHAARPGGRLLLGLEGRAGAPAPVAAAVVVHAASPLSPGKCP